MKLNSAQLERTLNQFEAEAIPDDHPLIQRLNDLFGEHTFLLDRHGLNIVEPVEPAGESAMVVNLADWSGEGRSGLEVHEPEATDIVIKLGLKHPAMWPSSILSWARRSALCAAKSPARSAGVFLASLNTATY